MSKKTRDKPTTRLLFLGDTTLADGFRLIGFETWVEPTAEQLEQTLQQLIEGRCSALVILDSQTAQLPSRSLQQLRREGGRVIISEVPLLNAPLDQPNLLDQRIRTLFGNRATEGR